MKNEKTASNSHFITVLTEGEIKPDVENALKDIGYEISRATSYSGYATTEFKRKGVANAS